MTDVILYQSGPFTVRTARTGFEVYQDRGVAAVRVASIGFPWPAHHGRIAWGRARSVKR